MRNHRQYLCFFAVISVVSAGCASNQLKSDLTQYRGLVMDADLTKERGGVGNYVFQDASCGCEKKPTQALTASEPVKAEPLKVLKPSTPAATTTARLVGTQIEISQQVNFNSGKSTLTNSGKTVLNDVAKVIKDNQGKIEKVMISGHTDHYGEPNFNLSLSEKRAASVKDYLVSRGISADILESKGYGMTQPKFKVGKATPAELALNRRVEFNCAMK